MICLEGSTNLSAAIMLVASDSFYEKIKKIYNTAKSTKKGSAK